MLEDDGETMHFNIRCKLFFYFIKSRNDLGTGTICLTSVGLNEKLCGMACIG